MTDPMAWTLVWIRGRINMSEIKAVLYIKDQTGQRPVIMMFDIPADSHMWHCRMKASGHLTARCLLKPTTSEWIFSSTSNSTIVEVLRFEKTVTEREFMNVICAAGTNVSPKVQDLLPWHEFHHSFHRCHFFLRLLVGCIHHNVTFWVICEA